MKKILLIGISLVLLTGGTTLAGKPVKPPPVDYEAMINAETDARIAVDADLQNQINEIPVGGIHLYDANYQSIGSVLLFSLIGPVYGLSPMDYFFAANLGGNLVPGEQLKFNSTDCTGSSYIVNSTTTEYLKGKNSFIQGIVFPIPGFPNLLFYLPKNSEPQDLILYSYLDAAGVCQDDYAVDTPMSVFEVFPNDPIITGLEPVSGPIMMGH